MRARRGKELPFRVLGVANGDPGLPDDVNVTGKFVDIARFEVQRIVR